jgi:HlyD family secretion protein
MSKDSGTERKTLLKTGSLWLVAMASIASLVLGLIGTNLWQKNQQRLAKLSSAETMALEQNKAKSRGVSALGRLEPRGEIISLGAPSLSEGSIIKDMRVEQGDQVRKGQIIAVLDSFDRLQAALQEANQEVKLKQAELDKVLAGAQQGELLAQSAEVARQQAQLRGQAQANSSQVALLEAQLARDGQAQQAEVDRLEAQLNREVEAQQAEIDKLKAQLRRETEAKASEVAKFQAQLQRETQAKRAEISNLQRQLAGEINKQNATIARLEAELRNAEAELKRNQELFTSGVISASAFDTKRLDVETAKERINEAKAELEKTKETLASKIEEAEANLKQSQETLQQEIKRNEANLSQLEETGEEENNRLIAELNRKQETGTKAVKQAEANLQKIWETGRERINEAEANLQQTIETGKEQINQAEATLDKIAEVRPVDVATAKATLEKAQASQARAQADLDTSLIRSPVNGQVLKVITKLGEKVTSNRGIVELGRTDEMYVVAEIYETDIGKVKLDQNATITSSAFSGKLKGSVTQIGMKIDKKDILEIDPAADTDARIVEVKIRLDPESSKLVTGFTNLQVEVKIDI